MKADDLLLVAAAVTSVGCGVMAGLFYAFSFTVMDALDRQPEVQATKTMQSINETIIRPAFFFLFFGTAAACAAWIVAALVSWERFGNGFFVCGGAVYLLGSLAVTIGINVPMNNALAALSPESEAAKDYWLHYVTRWTKWNHVRFWSSLVAAALFVLGATLSNG